jgi:hypothetical protein
MIQEVPLPVPSSLNGEQRVFLQGESILYEAFINDRFLRRVSRQMSSM